MFSLFLRNLFFTILQPGMVAGLFPYWILGNNRVKDGFSKPFLFHHYCGLLLFMTGFLIMLKCIVDFAVRGRGTLSPADPTKHLVITGLYRFSRNPMYVGVTTILTGEAVFFQSIDLYTYLLFIFIGFNLFIRFVEEPRLRKDFSEVYKRYCQKVRRWI